MKLTRLRLVDHLVTVNEEEWPVKYHYQVASIGLVIEVRISKCSAYITGRAFKDGVLRHTGRGCLIAYSDSDLYRYISGEAFNIAATLGISDAHIWPLLEKFPEFSENGVKISDAQKFEAPIRDLLARGVDPQEVVISLGISRDLYEFVTCEKLAPPLPEPVAADEEAPGW